MLSAPDDRAQRELRVRRPFGVLAVVVAGLWPAVELVRIAHRAGQATYLSGDQALIELASRRAWQLDQLVGPYSRYGWHHLGPALFYLLAAPIQIFGSHGPGLSFGTVAINGLAAVATVAVVWRRCGALAALFAALAVDALCLSLSMTFLHYPWNPNLIVVPLVLLTVLCADAVRGSTGSLVWMAVVGSYVAQTHISAAAYCVAMGVTAVVAFGVRQVRFRTNGAWRRRTFGARRPRAVTAGTGAVVFAGLWLPPIVELWRDHPNNITLLWDFFTRNNPTPPLSAAVHASLDAMTILPFRNSVGGPFLVSTFTRLAIGCGGMLIVAVAAVLIGWRRRQTLALTLAGAAALGGIIGIAATTRATGGLFGYLVVWEAFVPCVLLIALGVAVLGPADRPAATAAEHRRPPAPAHLNSLRFLAAVLVGAGAVITPITVEDDLRVVPLWTQDQTVATLAVAGERMLRPSDRWVSLTIGTAATWPDAAGLVVELERAQHHTTVTPTTWITLFGHERLADRPVAVHFDLYQLGDQVAAKAFGGAVLTTAGTDVLAYKRDTPAAQPR